MLAFNRVETSRCDTLFKTLIGSCLFGDTKSCTPLVRMGNEPSSAIL
uniref:Uncharacterized protein n=1 Tax=Rhizophora mucronata TaxID=61149 RepID=A0A2P2QC80_RHIMU